MNRRDRMLMTNAEWSGPRRQDRRANRRAAVILCCFFVALMGTLIVLWLT